MSTARHRPHPHRTHQAAALLAVSAVLLAGCSGGDAASSAGAATAGDQRQGAPRAGAPGQSTHGLSGSPAEGSSAHGAGTGGSARGAGQTAEVPAPVGSRIARTASLQLRVADVPRAAATIRTMVTGLDGYVVSEQIGSSDVAEQAGGEPGAQASAVDRVGEMTLSVPSVKLDPTLDRLVRLGTVVDRSTSSEDVTAQYVDTESRLRTMRASVDRVRALMGRATALGQVVQLEGELSRRQGDLEALESQLALLEGSVERSTVTVRLLAPVAVVASGHGTGFTAGLTGGWRAFTTSVTGVLTAVGAVLPFAVVAALVGAPALWRLRRRRAAPGGPGAGQVTGSPVPDGPAAR
jgi:Domain of unknown function (DUF4349)